MGFTLTKCSAGVKRGFVDFMENLIFYLPDAFPFSGFLSVFLVLSLILSLSACAAQTGTATVEQQTVQVDSSTELFLSLTEKTSKLSAPMMTGYPCPPITS